MTPVDLLRMAAEQHKEKETQIAADIQARMLLDAYADLAKEHQFGLGQLVQLKPTTRGQFRYPIKDHPAIVISVFDPPFKQDSSDVWRGEDMNIKIGVFDSDGDFLGLTMPSRYFEPYEGPVLPEHAGEKTDVPPAS